MSISAKVPRSEAEVVLLEELGEAGGSLDTKTLVARSIGHFPTLTQRELERRVNGREPWWPGRFGFDLNSLKHKGEARNPEKGQWAISEQGRQRVSSGYLSPTITLVGKLRDIIGRHLDSAHELKQILGAPERIA